MESLQKTKNRISSAKNINQITKAMELVAATKMRKSQAIALSSRAYAYAALDFLANLSKLEEAVLPPLLQKREIKKTAFVVVASDKGLAGSFNSSVFRTFEKYLVENKIDIFNDNYSFIAFGQKSANYLQRKKVKIANVFAKLGDFTQLSETRQLADFLSNGYLTKQWDRVLVFSMNFRTALRQEVLIRQILPVEFEVLKKTIKEIVPETGKFSELRENNNTSPSPSSTEEGRSRIIDYLVEPSPEIVLKELAPHLIEMQVYHIILEANASEHAARRMAMKNASDNAEKLVGDLTLIYNKSRQAAITREIIEITAGAEVL
ncbi:MAG: ATP synthase F1 subunit gamma [Candidatus Portnoybacteria bacterium CG_4_8_14_3_um_filter_44_10]|uniref:ATP synthase gamma chain n=5 Tax=Candidatus Portnoyibacteriota TaxID=1817913 RepID=A0A2H0KQ27_9BACT|nr:MAG: ATP synthase F1 subunit gamma [Parcubacteria group bacterium CG2_30_44_18]PIQ74250.1 MAG: ATP synthase F1 subunit gamma [Candidatus Portnoybacteria bacterium CG11_big_fil_rev_8_21_14_0_20_44_10]PIS16775.1 MAG: ATP synthase F1 subunit gamma [Candidatus Portnoybacteria bacterium CG09_land_8_20_14_0_10_44_13]PIW75791.1 MAG: ATP synthase F1 subunit gamma [Candidatus Portnoybacteria bacterium CG_4_8_14_3_um_filter_44_10]PIZ71867.1 MAG: ATP synthase F1 subunit gamma [Candidatus Portnoybacteri